MDIYQLLPLLDGWKRIAREEKNIKVPNGVEKEIAKTTERGWIVGALISYTGAKTSVFNLYYHDRYGERHTLSTSPALLDSIGALGVATLNGTTLVDADDTNLKYTMLLNPPRPIPYYASENYPMRLTVKAIGSDVVVNFIAYELIVIIDEIAFVRSLRGILSGDLAKRLETSEVVE